MNVRDRGHCRRPNLQQQGSAYSSLKPRRSTNEGDGGEDADCCKAHQCASVKAFRRMQAARLRACSLDLLRLHGNNRGLKLGRVGPSSVRSRLKHHVESDLFSEQGGSHAENIIPETQGHVPTHVVSISP